MKLNEDKIDDAALAILSLTLHDEIRVWKALDWSITDRLHERGLIENPVGKSRSVILTKAGVERAAQLRETLFGK